MVIICIKPPLSMVICIKPPLSMVHMYITPPPPVPAQLRIRGIPQRVLLQAPPGASIRGDQAPPPIHAGAILYTILCSTYSTVIYVIWYCCVYGEVGHHRYMQVRTVLLILIYYSGTIPLYPILCRTIVIWYCCVFGTNKLFIAIWSCIL
jgi:hypothetical protein